MDTSSILGELPAGWRIVSCQPSQVADDHAPFGLSYEDLLEDFIVVHSDDLDIALEVDWLPERSPSGQFILSAIDFSKPDRLAESYAKPLRNFRTRSLRCVIDELRSWMFDLARHDKTA